MRLPPSIAMGFNQDMADSSTTNQGGRELISTFIDLEQLDTNLFRSRSLAVPATAVGVYGGQVISQAMMAATNCVNPMYGLHSIHGYFLFSASPSVPILYYVDRLRDGRSYSTRSVRAVQKGKAIFILIGSFHKPEPHHPFHQWTIPADLPKPEEVEIDCDFYRRRVDMDSTDPRMKERSVNPLQSTIQMERKAPDGTSIIMHYMRMLNIPKYKASYQKCILGYMSDHAFLPAAARALGLKTLGEGSKLLSMTPVSLDHSIYFYSDDFDCSDWILYVVRAPRTGSGRAVVQGQMYIDGTLVAITTQEGVVRSGTPKPIGPGVKNKL